MKSAVLPKGCVEYSPADQQYIDRVVAAISSVYQQFGYNHLDTSIMQYLSFLQGEGEVTKEIYSLARAKQDEGGSETDYALRFDLTKPLARYVEEHRAVLTFPFKRWDYGQVFRGERPQKGRQRQFYQCDFDVVGENTLSNWYDVEVCQIVVAAMIAIGVQDFTVRINNRKLVTEVLDALKIDSEIRGPVMTLIDKRYKVEKEVFLTELSVLTSPQICDVLAPVIFHNNDESLKDLLHKCGLDTTTSIGFAELQAVFHALSKDERGHVVFDFSIVRGLDYYTGFVFETFLGGSHRTLGSVFSGGRYEKLIESGKIVYPGVGGSVGVSRLANYLQEVARAEQNNRVGTVAFVDEALDNTALMYKIQELRTTNETINIISGTNYKRALKIAIESNVTQMLFIGNDGEVVTKIIE